MATFYILQGPDKGKTLKTQDDLVLIGRTSDQIPLTDNTVSRRHVQLKREGQNWTIYDLNSVNGTYLNGVRLARPVRLKHGDQIRVGSTLMVYAGDDTIEQYQGKAIPQDLVTLDVGSDAVDASILATAPANEDSVVMAAPETASAVKAWRVIRELSDVIGSLLPTDRLLARVLDIIFGEVEVDRGVIFVRDQETGDLLPEVVRVYRKPSRPEDIGQIIASRTIMNHVVENRDGVLCSNAISDHRFRSGKSVQNLGMRSVICVPVVAREQVLGVIHLDCPVTRHTYTEHELKLIIAIGYQTGLAIENARLVLQQVAQERLAAAGETVAYLSHSIKNILQGVVSGSDVVDLGLRNDSLDQVQTGWGIVKRNVGRVHDLMMNMLAFSKEREPRLEMVQVNRVVEEAVAEMQAPADRKGVVLLSDLDDHIPPGMLDRDGLHQLLLNLISNAIDAVEPQAGIINVRTTFDTEQRVIGLSVADNGPGVPPELRDRIFEPFQSTKGHGGTGLGLAVARKFVHEMHGEIELRTPAEGGAEFAVQFQPQRDTAASEDTLGPAGY